MTADEIIKARVKFTFDYCKKKGWIFDPKKLIIEQLTFEQILEIRKQPEWINPKTQTDV